MPRCLVIMFHYVHDRADLTLPRAIDLSGGVKGLTPTEFESQLDDVLRQFEPIDWPTFRRTLDGEASVADDSVLLTFDDGLADHARVVCPILERRGLRGVFFVSTVTLDGQTLLAAHALHFLLAALGDTALAEEIEIARAKLGLGAPPILARPAMNYAYESNARAALKHRLHFEWPTEARNAILDDIFRRYLGAPDEWARAWYLRPDDLLSLEAAGHTIGGHGHRHEPLSRLTPAERDADLARCYSELTRVLGPSPRPLSYPFGDYPQETLATVRRVGFAQAFTTESRSVRIAHDIAGTSAISREDAFQLPRVDTIHVARQLRSTQREAEIQPSCP